ncbi:MAG: PKD domain-containing protein [Cryomorphaceae bacterium]|nr:PKD domain-containing protein [Cryomorphaceae bacterium]
MNRNFAFLLVFTLSIVSLKTTLAQCINTNASGTATVGVTNTTPLVIAACNQANQYATITVQDPGVYEFASAIAGDYITITDASNNVIDHGPQPFPVVIRSSGIFRMHITADANCATNTTCRQTTVQYLTTVPAPLYVPAPQTNNSTSTLRGFPGNSAASYFRNSYIILGSEYAASGIDSGSTFSGVGFTLAAPSSGSVSAHVKIYLQNTSDVTYLNGTAWTGIITGMTLVFDDTITIPQGVTSYTIPLSSTFDYGGESMYFASDWALVGPPLITALNYLCETSVVGGLVNGQSTVSPPPTLNQTSNWRPEILWGMDRKSDDFAITQIFAKGSNLPNFGYPEDIQVRVENRGFLAGTKTISLNVSGANTFTSTQSITLASDEDTLLTFSGFSATNLGYNTITASVPPDLEPANDTMHWIQEVTDNRIGYADSTTSGLGGVGYNTGSGLLLNRYHINGERGVIGMRIRFSDNAAAIGNTVYAVVVDTGGNIVSQSANHTITAANLENYVNFTFQNPVTVDSESFFIGLAQTANTATGYFPCAFQSENPTRANAYYTSVLTGGALSTVDNFRLMIDAILGAPPCAEPDNVQAVMVCDSISVSWTSSTSVVGSMVEYGPTGFTPGTGTLISGVSSPFSVSGLSSGNYDVYVADSCLEGGVSDFEGPFAVSTPQPGASFTLTLVAVGVIEVDAAGATNASEYYWDFGDGNIDSGVFVTHTYQSSGTFTVTLVAGNGCDYDTTTRSIVIVGVSVDEYGFENLSVFPNPSSGIVHLEHLPNEGGKITLQLRDMQGRTIRTDVHPAGKGSVSYDLQDLAGGTYYLTISNDVGRVTRPIHILR